ncbi:beta strand repeat-containing protein, partial [Bradyrhizobium macuxiense]|uniref:beta strand repeat-containing protein n=1 Tax=Bradyrhizobium macuxiense TaxID=1755647 RepID=UPI00191B5D86
VTEADEGDLIQVVATATNEQGLTAAATSTATSAVTDAAPTISTPTISGLAQEGQTLTASANAGQGDNPVSYQWMENTGPGGSYVNIAGATGSTYVVKESDEGFKIEVVATATNEQGLTAAATSTATSAVIDAAPTISTPTISGIAQEGQTLTASANAGQTDNAVSYQWQISTDGGTTYTNIAGATGATYQVTEADEDDLIQVVAIATNEQGLTAAATSTATSAVLDAAPTISTPTISGTAQEGQTLTASANAGQGDNPVSYQWQISTNGGASFTNIAGATAATYVVTEADEGGLIQVVATATNDNLVTISATSAATSAVIDITPTLSTPVISGTAQEGQVLTATAAVANDADATISYQWQALVGGIWTNLTGNGASTLSYTVQEADEGHQLRIVATSTDSDGSGTAASSLATPAVIDITPTLSTPVISGTAQEGQVLTATAAVANDADVTISYQWQALVGGIWTNLSGNGATTLNYTVQEVDEGQQLRIVATSTDSDGSGTTATSTATAAVTDAAPTISTPTISGTAQEGQTLTASANAGQADNAVSYQWQISTNGGTTFTNIAGATAATYVVTEADEGGLIQVVATATNDNLVTTSATSTATAAVLDITLAFATAASISGTAQEGQTLTAVNGTLNDSDASVTGYQWTRDGVNISGATSSTYVVTEADETHVLRVVETATDSDGGPTVTSTSAATSAVIDITPTLSTPVISGTAQEGQVLTATAAVANDADATVSYQWQALVGGTWTTLIGNGATTLSYTVQEADEGRQLRIVATSMDTDGSGTSAFSAATSAVTDITPTLSTPVISGTAQEGQVLTATAAVVNDADATVGYQWQALVGGIWTTLIGNGATTLSYTVQEADEGHQLRIVATSTDSDGSGTTATSLATGVVTDITPTLSTPVISGTAQEGQVLTATAAVANDADATVSYQWQALVGGIWTTLIGNGATTLSYTVQEADEGHQLRIVATSTDSDGSGTTATSSATTAVIDSTNTLTTVITKGTNTRGTATFIVTFSEAVTNVALSDFAMTGTAATGAHPPTISLSGSGTTYTVTATYAPGQDSGLSLGINFQNNTNVKEAGGSLAPGATGPQFTNLAPAGVAGTPINLGLTNSSESPSGPITVTMTGVPTGWSLNEGTDNGNGSWTAQTGDPASLTLTPPASFTGATVLQVNETWANADGSTGSASVTDNVEAYAPGSPIFALSGDDHLTGGGGNDLFVFSQPIGNDTIDSFNVASDQIDLVGFGITSFSDVQANLADDANGNAVITIGNGETITLQGVSSAWLTASNFVFDQTPVTQNPATMSIGDGAILPLSGIINNTGTIGLNSTGDETDLELIQNGITLQGGGQLILSDNAQNVVFGTSSGVTLINVDNTISGAGQLGGGQLDLVNEATIDASGMKALVVDTGSNAIVNSGTLEATGSGGLVIDSAVQNSGNIWANGGNVDVTGVVTGSGTATISGAATLEFAAASAENTTFATGATGTLKLDQAENFTGTVSGFGAGDTLDFSDISAGANLTVGYTANSAGTGGTLSISDGTHSASIALFGQFAAAGFQVGSDAGGGAMVTYAPPDQTAGTLITPPKA